MGEKIENSTGKWAIAVIGIAVMAGTVMFLLLERLEPPEEIGIGYVIMVGILQLSGTSAVVLGGLSGLVLSVYALIRTHCRRGIFGLILSILVLCGLAVYLNSTFRQDVPDSYPLHTAARNGNLRTVKKLLARGVAGVNDADFHGCTPLQWAVDAGNLKVAEHLLQNGANANTPYPNHYTPMHVLACSKWCPCQGRHCKCSQMIEVLIKYGANVNAPDSSGGTPLHCAVEFPSRVQVLLNCGANVNAVNSRGETPLRMVLLHCASGTTRQRQKQTVEILLQNGARFDVKASPSTGRTALALVQGWQVGSQEQRQQQKEIIELLEKHSKGKEQNP